jgi:hypothetical protein
MEEIGNHIYLETSFAGVALGAIKLDQGLLLIDSPLMFADQQSWRRQTEPMSEGYDRCTLMLDTHIDRLVGLAAQGGVVLGQDKVVEILANRPVPLRTQELAAGSDLEAHNLPVSDRWTLPVMTFSQDMHFYSEQKAVTITHQPGGHLAGCWVRSDAEQILFVGDSVVEHQPPFLAWSDLDIWLDELSELQSEPYVNYRIISSRSGEIHRKAIVKQTEFIQHIQQSLPDLAAQANRDEAIADFLPGLLRKLNFDRKSASLYRRRLAVGLAEYLKRHGSLEGTEE